MATFEPPLEQIRNGKIRTEPGELYLLNFLEKVLTDEYEVYFQPFINGDNPDIIIMKRDSAVMIIEVKDWHLTNYYIDEKTNWRLQQNNAFIKSPFSQVFHYKQSLFDIHDKNLFSKNIFNSKTFSIIVCAVYFHNVDMETTIRKFLETGHQNNEPYKKFLEYNEIIGRNELNAQYFQKILERRRFTKRSNYFDSDLYHSFRRLFKPPFHTKEEGIEIKYSPRQMELLESKPSSQKIKGAAGSGKTFILAKRAVNAHIRTKERVLILTYNITLKNYIHDKISQVRENFEWEYFFITNYHNFMNSVFNGLGIGLDKPENLSDEEEKEFFENHYADRNHFQNIEIKNKYKAIFIDEVQDYDIRWLNIIKDFFLADGGEYVIFGDEKQNIFHRELDTDKKIVTNIPGRWNELKDTYRLSRKISELANDFQKYFFKEKYSFDLITPANTEAYLFEDKNQFIEYKYINEGDQLSIEKFTDIIYNRMIENEINNNDVCIMAGRIELLREIERQINIEKKLETTTSFETVEEFNNIMNDESLSYGDKNKKIQRFRKNRKYNFWMNSGKLKLVTVHSFKGWEIHTLFLIIENEDKERQNDEDNFISDELIYTALTRCRYNLFIINIQNEKYNDFFKDNQHTRMKN